MSHTEKKAGPALKAKPQPQGDLLAALLKFYQRYPHSDEEFIETLGYLEEIQLTPRPAFNLMVLRSNPDALAGAAERMVQVLVDDQQDDLVEKERDAFGELIKTIYSLSRLPEVESSIPQIKMPKGFNDLGKV